MIPKIISFSGGQTSGYMLRREIDRVGLNEFRKQFTTIFCNTGKEHNATLDFVHEVETKWEIPIVWLEYTRVSATEIDPLLVAEGRKRNNLEKAQATGEDAHWFRVTNYEGAARDDDKWTPFDELLSWMPSLPNVRGRACSAFLKIRTSERFLYSYGFREYEDYIGIRYDEQDRATEILANPDSRIRRPQFPLVDGLVTKMDVDAFWEANDFRLNIPNHQGNCRLCFLKARWKRVAAAKADPKSAQWWADWESRKRADGVTHDGARFIKSKGNSYAAIIHDSIQPDLFLDMSEEDIPCSCAVGGYRSNDDE